MPCFELLERPQWTLCSRQRKPKVPSKDMGVSTKTGSEYVRPYFEAMRELRETTACNHVLALL